MTHFWETDFALVVTSGPTQMEGDLTLFQEPKSRNCRTVVKVGSSAPTQVVALSMALTPYLAELGALLSTWLDKGDVKLLQPDEGEMKVGMRGMGDEGGAWRGVKVGLGAGREQGGAGWEEG